MYTCLVAIAEICLFYFNFSPFLKQVGFLKQYIIFITIIKYIFSNSKLFQKARTNICALLDVTQENTQWY